MDKAVLVEPDIDAGKHLLSALERAGLAIAIAAWLKMSDSIGWSLFIASPDVQKYGPTTVNKFIDKIRVAIASAIEMDEITATNTTNHFINDLSPNFFSSSIHSKGGIYRLNAKRLANTEIEDGLVYKVDRNVRSSREAPRPNAEALRRAKKLAA